MKVVYLNDEKLPYNDALHYFDEAAAWASRQCQSYVDYEVQEVSDVSLVCDQIAQYRFTDLKDALMFELKWK